MLIFIVKWIVVKQFYFQFIIFVQIKDSKKKIEFQTIRLESNKMIGL